MFDIISLIFSLTGECKVKVKQTNTLTLQIIFDLCIWLDIPSVCFYIDFNELYIYLWMAVYSGI